MYDFSDVVNLLISSSNTALLVMRSTHLWVKSPSNMSQELKDLSKQKQNSMVVQRVCIYFMYAFVNTLIRFSVL